MIELPPLFEEGELAEIIEFRKLASNPVITISLLNLLIDLLAGYSLKYMWKIINVLQFIVFFNVWQAYIPPKARMLIEEYRKLAFFEVISDQVLRLVGLKTAECKATTEEAQNYCEIYRKDTDEHRLGTKDFLENAGVMGVGLGFLVLLLIILLILLVLGRRNAKI